MARFSCSVLVTLALLGLLAGVAAAAARAIVTDGGSCEVSALAADVAASCAAGAATPPCCEPVLASVELGGGACLCRLALEARVLHGGLNGSALAALYAGCGGGGATFLAACHGALPSGSGVLALPSAGAGAHLADVAKDSVGGTSQTPSASSGLGGPASPTHDIIKVISLSSDDRKMLRWTISWDLIGVFVVLVYVAIQICRCIYYGCKG